MNRSLLLWYCSTFCAAGALLVGCGTVPLSIRQYASELPARADGQYGVLDDAIKKQLVMKDSLLQCRIDRYDGTKEEQSPSCKCANSAADDWLADCKTWLGTHTPAHR
jgi:hypothetical protein